MKQEQFHFFFRSHNPFSNWYKCDFTIDDIKFNYVEQAMMYYKAKLFKDDKIVDEILLSNNPKEQKSLGRKVKNFDNVIWEKERNNIVYKCLEAKFTQNKDLLEMLLKTHHKTLVKASPYDTIWGIGLDSNDVKAKNRNTWRGLNLLGELLTKLIEDLMK